MFNFRQHDQSDRQKGQTIKQYSENLLNVTTVNTPEAHTDRIKKIRGKNESVTMTLNSETSPR